MPYDLITAAALLRSCHHDSFAFRTNLLDLMFATGCAVSEQAVALDGGDAMCLRASGPAAPSLRPPLVIAAVDLDPPHLAHVASETESPASWPPSMASLGGPTVAVTWMTVVHTLVSSATRRPWVAMYFRGPAHGLGAYVRSILADAPGDAEIVQIVPSVPESQLGECGPFDLVRLDLVRSRNVWRFPACDHTYALAGQLPWQQALGGLLASLDSLGDTAWTLHDVHLYHCDETRIAAILRTSAAVDIDGEHFHARQMSDDQRLMFPVNDTLGALEGLAPRLPRGWAEELRRPLHLHVLPDGLRLYFRVPTGASTASLPERTGTLHCDWQVEPLSVVPTLAVLPLAVAESERMGPVPPGAVMQGSVVWQAAVLDDDGELGGLGRAIKTAIEPL